MLVSENFEDVDHGQASIIPAVALSLYDGEESVQSRLELGPCSKSSRQGELCIGVICILSDGCLEIRDVVPSGLTEARCSLESLDIGIGNELAEDDEGLVDVPAIDEEGCKARSGLLMIGMLLQNLAKDVLSSRRVT